MERKENLELERNLYLPLKEANSLEEFLQNPTSYSALNLANTKIDEFDYLNLTLALIDTKESGAASLTSICLDRVNIEEKIISAFFTALLEHTPNLISLSCSNMNLSENAILSIAESIKTTNNQIAKLTFANSQLSPGGAVALVEALNCNSLTELDLSENSIGCEINKIADKLRKCKSLSVLNLFNTGLSNDGIEYLAEWLNISGINRLHTLNLSGNLVGSGDVQALAEWLASCDSLSVLKLANAGLIEENVIQIAGRLVQSNTVKLAEIDLCENGMSDISIKALAEWFSRCTVLTMVDLSHNLIGNEGARALAEGLAPSKDTLSMLNLAQNRIGDSGGQAILNLASEKLELLFLNDNFLSESIRNLFYENRYDIGSQTPIYQSISTGQEKIKQEEYPTGANQESSSSRLVRKGGWENSSWYEITEFLSGDTTALSGTDGYDSTQNE